MNSQSSVYDSFTVRYLHLHVSEIHVLLLLIHVPCQYIGFSLQTVPNIIDSFFPCLCWNLNHNIASCTLIL